MLDSFRRRQIELIYSPLLTVSVEAGWYDAVKKELDKNLEFVRLMDNENVSAVYENASLWLDSVKDKAMKDGKDSLLNRSHRLLIKYPDYVVNQPF